MGRKLGTSDLHFGHTNILKFTDRVRTMKNDILKFPHDLWGYYESSVVTQIDKRRMTEVHDSWLLAKLNSQINDDDVVYHLGDFSFFKASQKDKLKEIIDSLKGSWLFILGNHDNESHLREACKGTRHKVLGHYHEIHVNDKKVCLFHYPVEEWHHIHRGAWHLHGHLHGQKGHGGYVLKDMKCRMDIGIDAHPEHKIFDLEYIVT